jgi:uncharacterized membrane protein (DUF485 family)
VSDSMIPPPPPKPDEPGVFEDLIDIFASPAKVFARRAKGGGAAIYFIVAIAMAGLGMTARPIMDNIAEAQALKGMEANPQFKNMPADQKAQTMSMQRKFFAIFYIAGPFLILLLMGLFVWIFGKMFGAAVTFGFSVVIASLAYVPRLIGFVVTNVMSFTASDTSKFVNPSQVSVGPAFFFDPTTTSAVLLATLLRFDLLVIWSTVLIGIAYYAGGKAPKGKAIGGAVTLWLVASLFAIWGASRQG